MSLKIVNIIFMSKMVRKLFYLILIIVAADFFSDSISRTYDINFMAGDPIIKGIVSILFFIIFIIGIKYIPKINNIWIPFWIIVSITIYGVVRGLCTNILRNTLNDASSFLAILLIPVITNFKINDRHEEIRKILKIFVLIILIKVFAYELLTYFLIGSPSWKILVKQSPFLLIPFSVYLADLLKSGKNKIMFFLTIFLLISAMARMIFVSLILICIFYFFRMGGIKSIFKIIIIFVIIFSAFYLYLYMQSVDQGSIFEHLYGGSEYKEGMDYRVEQFAIIMNRYMKNPFLGVGLGYFTPNYLTYQDLPKPYLLELDLLNYFSKIGIVLSIAYLTSYYFLYKLIKRVKNKETKQLFLSIFIGLISILIYSVGQTAHQSYLYWICYSILYGYLILEIKAQEKKYQVIYYPNIEPLK